MNLPLVNPAAVKRAVETGGDREARSAMLIGSMLAGQAFANSPVAAVHPISGGTAPGTAPMIVHSVEIRLMGV